MLKAPIPLDETARLISLHSLRILDTNPEDHFDRITRTAKRVFDVEICLISLVDSNRQWFKSRQGLDARETPREISFCGHAILDESVFVVEDATHDARFADNPLVTEAPFIRFYAGCPIRSTTGHRIGTICLIDSKPRDFSTEDEAALRDIASLVEHEIAVGSQVTIDELTQIANRRGFKDVAGQILSLCHRTGIEAELAFFDLDKFKEINDQHGHAVGDEVLRTFAKSLVKSFRSADVIARLGGDEFAVLLAGSGETAATAVDRLKELAANLGGGVQRRLGWSVGTIKFDPERHGDIDAMLADCDVLMYTDKMSKRETGT